MQRSTTRRVAAVTLVAALALAACGGDDDDAATTTPAVAEATTTPATTEAPATTVPETTTPETTEAPETTTPETTEAPATTTPETTEAAADEPAACGPYLEVNKAFSGEPDPTELTGWLDDLDANAPSEIADQLSVMTGAARAVLETGGQDFSAFESEEFITAQGTVETWIFENCTFDQTAEIVAQEYEFVGLDSTYEAGTLAVLATNEGNEAHEFQVARKLEGTTESWDELLTMDDTEAMSKIELVGGTFMPTNGSSGLAILDLVPGDYIAVCFVPTGTVMGDDGEFVEGSGPPHVMQGMRAEFTVS